MQYLNKNLNANMDLKSIIQRVDDLVLENGVLVTQNWKEG